VAEIQLVSWKQACLVENGEQPRKDETQLGGPAENMPGSRWESPASPVGASAEGEIKPGSKWESLSNHVSASKEESWGFLEWEHQVKDGLQPQPEPGTQTGLKVKMKRCHLGIAAYT